jgi:hydrogenase/urease accessory protein HupE
VIVRTLVLIVLLTAGYSPARAHDPGLSTAEVDARKENFSIVTGLSPADARQLLPPERRPPGEFSSGDVAIWRERWADVGPGLWEVRSNGRVIAPRETLVQVNAADAVTFESIYPPLRGEVTLRSVRLRDLPVGHRQFILVSNADGLAAGKKLLTADDATIEVDLSPVPATSEPGPPPTVFWDFVKMGVEHIGTGYDHLLFLLGLLVVCRRFSSMAVIVSSFTVAHSLTLGLATVGAVTLPGRMVEATIAASIVFVGVENLLRRGQEPHGRWALTFGFGLVHGFGFASVLSDLGVGRNGSGVLGPLVAFNLGVEIGQIALAAIALPLLWQLRRVPAWDRRITFVVSLGVTVAGLYWLIERTIS